MSAVSSTVSSFIAMLQTIMPTGIAPGAWRNAKSAQPSKLVHDRSLQAAAARWQRETPSSPSTSGDRGRDDGHGQRSSASTPRRRLSAHRSTPHARGTGRGRRWSPRRGGCASRRAGRSPPALGGSMRRCQAQDHAWRLDPPMACRPDSDANPAGRSVGRCARARSLASASSNAAATAGSGARRGRPRSARPGAARGSGRPASAARGQHFGSTTTRAPEVVIARPPCRRRRQRDAVASAMSRAVLLNRPGL